MTAFGLFVAIPAVLGYNALTRANKAIVDQAEPLRARPACVLRDGRAPVVVQARRRPRRCAALATRAN